MPELVQQKVTRPQVSCECKGGFLQFCWKAAVALWKYVMGVLFCQTLVGSIFANGWSYRMAQREVLRSWWKLARKAGDEQTFMQFIHGSTHTLPHRVVPNWFFEQNTRFTDIWQRPGAAAKLKGTLRKLALSLWLNFKTGSQQIFNTWVLTMPGCMMWLWSWYAGWNNSFNKGYENAAVGPITGFLGIFLFIAAMYYLPMAQMRQASTGRWRSFYDFKTVWQLVRRKWLALLGLALLYTGLCLPVTILKILPAFFTQINPELANVSATRALEIAKGYYFWSAFLVFGIFVSLRLVAARIYAAAVVDSLQAGTIHEEALGENEWEALHRLDLLQYNPRRSWHPVVEAIAWLGTKFGRFTTGFALFLAWFSFVGQIYVSEFFIKMELGKGWLNQPLVQLPWFNYTPNSLRQEAGRETDALPSETISAQSNETSPNR